MIFRVKHRFVSAKTNSADGTIVSRNAWDEDHEIIGLPNPNAPIYGNGADGALNFDGVNPVLGISPSSGVYALTRNIYPSSIAIGTNVIIDENNWRIFCSGAIIGNGNTVSRIQNDGMPGGNGVADAAVVQGGSKAAGYFPSTAPGSNGSSGNVINNPPPPFCTTSSGAAGGVGSIAGSFTGTTPTVHFQGGGGGGASVTGSSGVNGADGGSTTSLSANNDYDSIAQMSGQTNSAQFHYGTGGGNGGSTANGVGAGSNPCAGGGGGGAGCCFVAAFSISGVGISANGGRGGDGASGTIGTGSSAGGGGGGGGGSAVVHYGTKSATTITANGGLGGTKSQRGDCDAKDGGAGAPGWVFAYNLSGDGT